MKNIIKYAMVSLPGLLINVSPVLSEDCDGYRSTKPDGIFEIEAWLVLLLCLFGITVCAFKDSRRFKME